MQELETLGKRLGGIPVGEVLPGSAADWAGVELGDVVLRVNGIATPTFEVFLAVAEAYLAHIEFEVFRDGHLLRLRTRSERPRRGAPRSGRRRRGFLAAARAVP